MHPLFTSRRMLAYFGLWTIVLVGVAAAASRASATDWTRAAVALAAACLLEAFMCLSPWYMLRNRAGRSSTQIAAQILATAIAAGAFFGAVARIIDEQLDPLLPLLTGLGALLYVLSAGLHLAAISAAAAGRCRAPRQRSPLARARIRTRSPQVSTQPSLPVQQPALHQLAGHLGRRPRPRNVHPAGGLSPHQPGPRKAASPSRWAKNWHWRASYLDIERIRFGERLQVREEIDDSCHMLHGPRAPAPAARRKRRQARDRGTFRRRRDPARRRRDGPDVCSPSRTPSIPKWPAPRGAWHRPQPRASPPRGALLRRRGRSRPPPHGGIYRVELRLPCESPNTSSSRA